MLVMKTFFCFTLLTLGPLLAQGNNCNCADTWAGTTLPKRVAAFKDPPTTGEYEYIGVNIGPRNSYYLPCVCTDVLRASMTFTITDPNIYNEAVPDVSVAEKSVETLLASTISTLSSSTSPTLANRLESVDATFISKTAPSSTTYTVYFVLRGSDTTLADDLYDGLDTITLPDGVTISLSAILVDECTGDPPASPSADITRVWNGLFVPPTQATYECPDGEYVEPLGAGVVFCSHESLTWTTLPTLSCRSGCGLDPPDPPMNAYNNWDNVSRDIDDVVTYDCNKGHRSGDGNGETSTCTTTGWTPLSQTYYCKEMPCTGDIPQVPAHCKTDYNEKKTEADTEVTYTCMDGYRPKTSDYVIKCNLGEWDDLPSDWECINVNALSLAEKVQGAMDLPDSVLTPEEIERKKTLQEDYNYFMWVTIPSVAALVHAMLVCLCCTRINSPLFNICRGYAGAKNHDDYMDAFGKN